MAEQNRTLLCPSYTCKPGAKILGIVNASGFINYLQSTIEIDKTFVEEANKGRLPEKRFRFAGNCTKNGCKQWDKTDSQCGLIDTIVEVFDKPPQSELQHCPIRERCRWFAQRKKTACYNCNEVIRKLETKVLSRTD